MDSVSLTALVPLKYGGVKVKRGGTFQATPAHARVLKAIRRAADAPVVTKAAQYETADMAAEQPAHQPASSDISTEKRQYRRKDMTAKP